MRSGRDCDFVQTTGDAKTASGQRDTNTDYNTNGYTKSVRSESVVKEYVHTDIAPHWRPIDNIPVPHNRVNKVNEASQCRPNHEHACPDLHVPRPQMPPQGNDREEEADSGEYSERGIGGGHLGALRWLYRQSECGPLYTPRQEGEKGWRVDAIV